MKVLHGLDKVLDGGAVVLTLKDQNILADGDINEGETSLKIHLYFLGPWFPLMALTFFVIQILVSFTDVDMLENVEIGEQKRRNEAYKAAKKKTGIYDDK